MGIIRCFSGEGARNNFCLLEGGQGGEDASSANERHLRLEGVSVDVELFVIFFFLMKNQSYTYILYHSQL